MIQKKIIPSLNSASFKTTISISVIISTKGTTKTTNINNLTPSSNELSKVSNIYGIYRGLTIDDSTITSNLNEQNFLYLKINGVTSILQLNQALHGYTKFKQ
ncbi:hypothetical protein ACTFIV_004123 [Dictyostelium citrinum]